MRSPFLFSFGLIVLAGAAISACARATGGFEGDSYGDSSTGGNSSSSSSSASSSGAGGDGTGGGSSSTGGSGGAGGASSSSSSSSGCAEVPCKLVEPQCGCDDPAKSQCTILGKVPACVAAGAVATGKACGGVNGSCIPGDLCVTPAGSSASICERFCDDDSQCQAPGGLCVLTLNDGMGGSIPNVTLCTENCDPAFASSCPVAGTGCQIGQEQAGQMRFFTLCAGAGMAGQGASCATNADCAPSYGCFNTPSKLCLQYCKVNSPSCPAGAQCVPIQINMVNITIGNEQYGACL